MYDLENRYCVKQKLESKNENEKKKREIISQTELGNASKKILIIVFKIAIHLMLL